MIPPLTTGGQSYVSRVVGCEGGDLLDVEPVDVVLEQAKQRQVEGGQPGLLTLEQHTLGYSGWERLISSYNPMHQPHHLLQFLLL